MKSILDHKFRYTNSAQTDLKKTFARVRREMCRLEHADTAINEGNSKKVLQITTRCTAPLSGTNTMPPDQSVVNPGRKPISATGNQPFLPSVRPAKSPFSRH